MVRNILKYILLLISLLFYSSCSRLLETSTIISGNQKFQSGNYQGAIIDYLPGINSSSYKDYFFYNLGNVYSSMGESPAAFSVWDQAQEQTNTQLKFNLLYNRGVLEFQEGSYESAYEHFRQSLKLIPSNISAKINLELSLNKMSAATFNKTSDIVKTTKDSTNTTDETTRILEYVRQKEAMTWGQTSQDIETQNDW
ncbi:MAG: tetratricopeptide repeat protein [Spirochaetales bacterium]|nr:tetratricopeptide repeat protein [Spirochaetales bacterium]